MLDIKPSMAQTCTHCTLMAGCQYLVMERKQCTSADAWTYSLSTPRLHDRQLALHNFAAHGVAFSFECNVQLGKFFFPTSHCARCVIEHLVANAMSLLMLYLCCTLTTAYKWEYLSTAWSDIC